MAKSQGRARLIVTIVVLALTVIVVGGFAFWPNMAPKSSTETTDTSKTDTAKEEETSKPETSSEETTPTESTVDPANVSTIDIEPMSITVSYVKGIPGFDFAVKRTADRTEYVEFSAEGLVGTKCTDDTGVFVSIIKNPSSEEDKSTITKTTKVGNISYGLSLNGKNCTGDQELFEKYQASFSNAFSLLKEL